MSPVPIKADRTEIGANNTLCPSSKKETDRIGQSAPTIRNNEMRVLIMFNAFMIF